jgi:excisionase family DNA binding protein
MRLLTADEVAARLQLPRSWVYRAAREGRFPYVQCGRYVRFTEADVATWVQQQRQPGRNGRGQ